MTVSIAARRHFEAIAAAERASFEHECAEAGGREPGENLSRALRLMEELQVRSPEAEPPPMLRTIAERRG